MTIPPEIIECAVREGWVPIDTLLSFNKTTTCKIINGDRIQCEFSEESGVKHGSGIKISSISWQQTILDPEFWKCLGRDRGWNARVMPSGRIVHDPSDRQAVMLELKCMWQAQRLFDLILTSQPTTDYWNNILKS